MCVTPAYVKQKIKRRKRLLLSDKRNNFTTNSSSIKLLNKEIKDYFNGIKLNRVERAAMGPKVNLWKAVNIAKDVCHDGIPK